MNNVVGLKDCSGSQLLVSELSRHGSKPILCGDDLSFFDMLGCGAAGGMLASANVHTASFLGIYEQYRAGQVEAARADYDRLVPLMKLLFKESNPAPIKWLLSATGEISSDTLRLPMTSISEALREELGAHLAG
ncbi:4-hydroxy-tetrahydrodipicolinate synthase [compost metagenome]